ncbi:hypothetical protein ACF0H5_002809 [Mactra antiquata]
MFCEITHSDKEEEDILPRSKETTDRLRSSSTGESNTLHLEEVPNWQIDLPNIPQFVEVMSSENNSEFILCL